MRLHCHEFLGPAAKSVILLTLVLYTRSFLYFLMHTSMLIYIYIYTYTYADWCQVGSKCSDML